MNRREFGWAPGLQIAFCRICDTHISANRYGVFFQTSSLGEPMGFFQYAINLQTGEFWNIDGDTVVVNVYCSGCGTFLGVKYVLVEEPLSYPPVGTVLLLLEKLNLLTGDGILEATTLVPLEPPESEAESDPGPEVKPDPKPQDQPEPDPEPEAEAEREVKPDPEPEAQPEPDPEPEPDDSS